MGGYSDEFPLLAAYNLYPAEIRGDGWYFRARLVSCPSIANSNYHSAGNCLFNALSDQIYGHQNEHDKIRARVIEYMRDHAAYYKQFIDVQPGGGTRRNPKRKNAGAYSSPTNFTPPTAEEIDRVFESHMGAMAKGGTYGDNMEITAFTAAFGIDVKIYQQDFAYMISAPEELPKNGVAYIAYHVRGYKASCLTIVHLDIY
jgi:OTU domain-containing protein 3